MPRSAEDDRLLAREPGARGGIQSGNSLISLEEHSDPVYLKSTRLETITGAGASGRDSGRHAALRLSGSLGSRMASLSAQPEGDNTTSTNWSFFLTIPMYLSYGVLLKLQSHLRTHLFISNTAPIPSPSSATSSAPSLAAAHNGTGNFSLTQSPEAALNSAGSTAAYIFGLCVSFFYIGCFTFRVGHNLLLGWKLKVSPAKRVYVGYGGMFFSIASLLLLYYAIFPDPVVGITTTAEDVRSHSYVMIGVLLCYFCAGSSMAIWEPNLLSTLTAGGHRNKMLAIVAVPLATNSVTCFSLFILGYVATTRATSSIAEAAIFGFAMCMCLLGMLVYKFKIEKPAFEASNDDFSKFVTHLRHWKSWLPGIAQYLVVAFLDTFSLSMSIAIGQYIYGVPKVPLLYPFVPLTASTQTYISHDYYMALYFFCAFVGGTISRVLAYRGVLRHPGLYLLVDALGIICIVSKIPVFAPLGMFFIMYANGAIYASIARGIDERVDHEFNLVAISFWLCCADIGGFVGANAVVPIHQSVGSVGSGVF